MILLKIKTICKKKKISLRSVEKAAGLSNGAISKWATSKPNSDSLKAVAKVLNVSMEELMESKD